jgi:hypothetical protein
VSARAGIDLQTDSDLRQTARGECRLRSDREATVEGRSSVTLNGHGGDVEVAAAGVVDLHGSRVLLNS